MLDLEQVASRDGRTRLECPAISLQPLLSWETVKVVTASGREQRSHVLQLVPGRNSCKAAHSPTFTQAESGLSANHLWTPLRLQAVSGGSDTRSDAAICPACDATKSLARMGVRGPEPHHQGVLAAHWLALVLPAPSRRLCAIPSFDRLRPPTPLVRLGVMPRLRPEPCNPLVSPATPKRCAPSCWRAQRSPAFVASLQACPRAMSRPAHRVCSPEARPRCCR
jgi:hypothetical protein